MRPNLYPIPFNDADDAMVCIPMEHNTNNILAFFAKGQMNPLL